MKIKTEKGITLLALIITVVVLLILATVAINQSGDGIIKQAEAFKDNAEKNMAEKNQLLDEVWDVVLPEDKDPVTDEEEHTCVEDSGTITKLATCKETGTKTYYCTICGKEMRTEIIELTDHNYVETSRKEATYTETGEIKYTCSNCGATKTEPIPIKSHTCVEDSGTITKAATCKETGTKTYYCTICRTAMRTEIIKLTDHNYVVTSRYYLDNDLGARNYVHGITKECTACGDTSEDYEEHSGGQFVYLDGNTLHTTCDKCANSYHVFAVEEADIEILEGAGCDTTGRVRYYCGARHGLGCTSYIDVTIPSKGGHDWGPVDISDEPTCTQSGVGSKTCKECLITEGVQIDPLGHDFDNGETSYCTNGVCPLYVTCANCSETSYVGQGCNCNL